MKKSPLFFACLLSFIFVAACRDSAFYETNKSISKRSWSYADTARFDVHVPDAKAKYAISVNVRHTGSYNYSNLFLLIHEKGPQIKDTAYRYEMKLAELDGRWTGNTAGNLYDNELLIKDNYTFPDTGIYSFAIEQNMRENPLHDITDIGIKLVQRP
ncbi:gliding motility lipoprotein GldH [Sphingobacterium oryzagri]|uniref:Gliding motility lipoprotein GldH n=1 Tax=Sphingobacterium oryzagri TaxID=3025669 RepID=A0ABY7WGJ5_9SPHI|nr:gliding motility lipoprotein GldH [Sphingobacterium sp. KACC 22765]WDF68764.1 gliding motility lipoprotein GldH [Sphingobacterium sp. KACC 22765]